MKVNYNPKTLNTPTTTTSGGVTLDDQENVVEGRLAVFAANGTKRLKTTNVDVNSIAGIDDSVTSNSTVWSSSKTSTEVNQINITKVGNNIIAGQSTAPLVSGTDNVILGPLSVPNLTSGSKNVCVGRESGPDLSTASNCICIGKQSGRNVLTNQNSIFIGDNTFGVDGKVNSIVIGSGAQSDESNQCVIGNTSLTTIRPSGTSCNLGTAAYPFQTLYATGGVQTSSVPTASAITSSIDYSPGEMLVSNMRSNITAIGGGVNRCWGRTATFFCGTAGLLAGRVVSLMDFGAGTDNTYNLRIGYCVNSGSETSPSVCPIGILLNNCPNIGDQGEICIEGICTAIVGNSDSSPERGSQICAVDANGTININVTGTGNEARVGFVAQSDSVSSNDPCLIYVRPWYQPY